MSRVAGRRGRGRPGAPGRRGRGRAPNAGSSDDINDNVSTDAAPVSGKVPPPAFPVLWTDDFPCTPIQSLSSKEEFVAKEAIKIQRKIRESPFYVTPPTPKFEIEKFSFTEETKKRPSEIIILRDDTFPKELIGNRILRRKKKKKVTNMEEKLKKLEEGIDPDANDSDENNEEEEDDDDPYKRLVSGEEQLSDSDDDWKARDDDDDAAVEVDEGGGDDD